MLPSLPVGSVAEELRLTRILLRRALEAEQRDNGDLPLSTTTKDDGGEKRQYRRTDHDERIGRLIDRIAKLACAQSMLDAEELNCSLLARQLIEREL